MSVSIIGIAINMFLFFFIKNILVFFGNKGKELEKDIKFTKNINFFLIFVGIAHILLELIEVKGITEYFEKIYVAGVIIYSMFIISELIEYFIRKSSNIRYVNGKETKDENYQTKVWKVISNVSIIIITSIIILKTFGFGSLLESGGFIGIIFAILAFTSKIWAPDLVEGLIIVKNELIHPGDVVKITGNLYLIKKIGFFEIVLINIVSNHTMIMKNQNFRNKEIEILNITPENTGLREERYFTIDYGHFSEKRETINKLKKLEELLFDKFVMKYKEYLNEHMGLQVKIEKINAVNIEIKVIYYLDLVGNLNTTSDARKIFGMYENLNSIMFEESLNVGISLEMVKKELTYGVEDFKEAIDFNKRSEKLMNI